MIPMLNHNIFYMSLSKLLTILVAIIGILWVIKYLYKEYKLNKLRKCGIYEIDKMDGKVFEKYLNALFTGTGFNVKLTRYVGDYGADLIISKDGYRTVVQAKRYKSKVGIKAVQEAVAAKGMYNCHSAMVVTNSFFTKPAYELAKANKVYMWNRNKLISELSKLN